MLQKATDIVTKKYLEIYSAYYKRAYLFAKSYVLKDQEAEDITSDSLIELWNEMKVREVEDCVALLFTILKHNSLDYLKHEDLKRNAIENIQNWQTSDLQLRIESLSEYNPNEIFSDDIKDIVHETLAKLPERTRNIFMLSRFDNITNKEIAELFHISEKGVEYHLSKALKVLKIALKDYLPVFLLLCR